jgi:Ca-activated chloride channel family protein
MSGPLLAALIGAGVVLALRAIEIVRVRRDQSRLADSAILQRVAHPQGRAMTWTRALLLVAGAAALASAIGLASGRAPETDATSHRETVFVLDASNSMLVNDVGEPRLALERRLATGLATSIPGRQGVVYFAGRGYVLAPLTNDASAILMYVESVEPSVVGRGGSAVVSGLRQALSVLEGGAENAMKAIVLFSDGEATVDEPTDALLDRAARLEVPIYTVGIGSASGGPVPYEGEGARPPRRRGQEPEVLYRRDDEGRIVVSHLEESNLRKIASATGGLYVAGDRVGIQRLAQIITGDDRTLQSGPGAGTNALLILAFVLLWTEGFLLRRG